MRMRDSSCSCSSTGRVRRFERRCCGFESCQELQTKLRNLKNARLRNCSTNFGLLGETLEPLVDDIDKLKHFGQISQFRNRAISQFLRGSDVAGKHASLPNSSREFESLLPLQTLLATDNTDKGGKDKPGRSESLMCVNLCESVLSVAQILARVAKWLRRWTTRIGGQCSANRPLTFEVGYGTRITRRLC